MNEIRNVVILHPKGMPDDSIAQWFAFIRGQVPPEINLQTGRDDFAQVSKFTGGWAGWARSVVERYDAAFVTTSDGSVGRVTAQIVEGMLACGKSVAVIDARGAHAPVSRVSKTTGRASDGWVLT